jgi:branched-chain amino acid transport system substrate-binding protein
MKRSLRRLAAFTLAAAGLAAAIVAGMGGLAANAASKKPIVFGFATAQTGPISAFDKPGVIGATLAIDALNKTGGILGRPIKIVAADTQSSIAQGSIAGDQVIADGANAVFVTPDYNFGGGAAREAQKHGLISISMGAGSPLFGVQGIGTLAYTMGMAAQTDGTIAAEWGYKVKHWRTAYMLNDTTTTYDTQYCSSFTTIWRQLGGKILGQSTFANTDPTIQTQVTAITSLSKAPDVIAVCSYGAGNAVAVKQLRDAGVKSALFGDNSDDGTSWYQSSIPTLSNYYYGDSASSYGDDPSAAVNAFDRAYKAKTGAWPPNVYALLGYVGVQAVAHAMDKAGTTNGKAVAAVMNTYNKQPFAVTVTFTPTLHIDTNRKERMIQVQNGKHSVAGLWTAQKRLPLFG